MREIQIGGKTFAVRSLRQRERKEHGLSGYGYGRFFYSPPEKDGGGIDQDKAEEGMDKALALVLGQDTVDEIDALDGLRGLGAAHLALVKETYGAKDEEKNSSPSGAGPQTASA